MPSPYKRSSSGYSQQDESKAKRYGELNRILYQGLANRKAAGEPGIAKGLDPSGSSRRAQQNYKDNLTDESGREMNRRNMEFMQGEVNTVLKANSRAQYESEREAGDPNALRLSFTEWKNLD